MKYLYRVFNVHQSSYSYWCRPKKLDVEKAIKGSLVSEAWNVSSGGSDGVSTIATIVTNRHDVKIGHWLAGKLMKELTIVSCQEQKNKYNRGVNERINIPNLLNWKFAVTKPDQVW